MSERTILVKAIRDMADFIEANESIPAAIGPTVNVFVNDKNELARIIHETGGKWHKHMEGNYAWIQKDFGGWTTLQVNLDREKVCRKVVTGQRTIEAQPERVVDVEEWVCDDAILMESNK